MRRRSCRWSPSSWQRWRSLGGALSWRAERSGGAAFKPEREVETERFVATLGMLAAGLFALVILMQGSAGLIIDGCVR